LKKLQGDEPKSKSFINTQAVNRDAIGPGSLIASSNRMSMIETRLSSQQESNTKVITPSSISTTQMSSKIAQALASKAAAKTLSA
jgi:hypothetical protein